MALDKANKDVFYLLGRYVAVVERSNNEFFNSSQMHNIQENTDNLMRYDHNKLGFADVRQQIMSNLDATGWPKKVLADADGGRFWIGYYHQKAALPMFTDKVERHTPERVEPLENNEIEILKDDRPATSE